MKTRFLILLFLCLHGALSSRAEAGVFSWVAPTVARQTIGGTVGTQQTLTDGVILAARYKGESAPSYLPKYFTRLDQYSVTANVIPGQVLPELGGPIGLGLIQGTEITFARQFVSQVDSLTSLPYTPDHLPLSSKRALEKLKPGDFASFNSRMNIMISAGWALPITGPLALSTGAQLGVSGDFLVQVFRMQGKKVRVRIFATSGKSTGAAVNVGMGSNLQFFSMAMANNLANTGLRSIVNFNPVSISTETGKSDLFAIDMVYDLSKPEASAAYDSLMNGKLIGATKEAAHLMARSRNANGAVNEDGIMLADFSASERIAKRDRQLPPKERSVDRIFKGTDSSTYARVGMSIDLNVVSLGESTTVNSEKISNVDRDGSTRRFLYQSVKSDKSAKAGFGYLAYQESFSGGLLMNANEKFSPENLSAFAMVRQLNVSNFDQAALEQTLIQLKQVLPRPVFDENERKIRDAWKFDEKHKGFADATVRTELFFDAASADHSLQLEESELTQKLKDYLKQNFTVKDKSVFSKFNGQAYAQLETRVPGLNRPAFCQLIACFGRDIEAIAHHLSGALSLRNSVAERLKHFHQLKEFSLFREIGGSFLASLLPESELSKTLKVKITMRARGAAPIDIEKGSISDEVSLKAFQNAQELLFNRGMDVRLYRDNNGELTSRPQSQPDLDSLPAAPATPAK